jgi:hypothetical protein
MHPKSKVYIFLLAGLLLFTTTVSGWNPFKAAAGAVKKGLSFAGNIAGSFGGGFIDSATSPTISHLEQSGQSLIASANKAVEERLNQFDAQAKDRLGQMDGILKDRTLQLDASVSNRIVQIDTVFATRIQQIDQMLANRIEQFDSAAERRIGNLDIVATKAALTLEETIIRALGLGCLMIFLSVAVWMAYKEGIRLWPSIKAQKLNFLSKWKAFLRELVPAIGPRLAISAIFLVGLWLAFAFLPGRVRDRAQLIAERHLKAMNTALAVFDFKEAYYHASQLKVFDASDPRLTAARLKLDLVRDVFARSSLAQSEAGFFTLLEKVKTIEQLRGSDPDPDVLTIKGFLLWRLASNKLIEEAAAKCFCIALKKAPKDGFALQSLAYSYLDQYLDAPVSERLVAVIKSHGKTSDDRQMYDEVNTVIGTSAAGLSLDDMLSTRAKISAEGGQAVTNLTPFSFASFQESIPYDLRPYLKYNVMVKQLRRDAGTSYLAMIDAFAQGETSKDKRIGYAIAVTNAWESFLSGMSDPIFIDTPVRLAPMLLNDAPYGRAALYADAKLSSSDAPPATNNASVHNLPRVQLQSQLDKYLGTNAMTRKMVCYQETVRYLVFEGLVYDFETHYSKYKRASDDLIKGQEALRAAISAAKLGIFDYSTGTPVLFAEKILKKEGFTPEELARTPAFYKELVEALQARQPGIL